MLLAQLYNLSISDNLGSFRHQKSEELTKIVQQRFHDLQNPKDCENTKKVICDLNKACGFGCQVHHVMYCFITSFFTNRVMILESKNWRYNPAGFEAYFKPMSDSCTSYSDNPISWNGRDYMPNLYLFI